MSRRPARSAARIALAVLLALQVLAVGAVPAGAAEGAFRLDLASKGDYVAQTNFVQCVGASMQMMLNMINPKDDRSARTQLRLQNLARELSGRRSDGNQRKGASVRGWSAGLNELGAGPYRLVGTKTIDEALRLAAAAMRQTNRPVGLLVWRGRHAWVMSGFHATADPRVTSNYKVTAAIVMDPLYPHGSSIWGPSPKPREALSVQALGRQFVPRRSNANFVGNSTDPTARATMSGLAGKYVLVLPYETIPTARLFPVPR
ncbi:MAG TPA: hypothetical protein VFO05_16020 [Candidatus Limnocylindrales bacterium]|nr:hypothetical protein [Candidatus Limnocylindrales bacterium]